MKSFLLGLVFLSLAASSGASPDTWRYHKFAADTSGLPLKEAARRVSFKYDRETRSIQLSKWEFDFDPPTADELSQVEHLDVFGAPPGSTVYSEGKWRRKNDVELEDALQDAKSPRLKVLENEYFALLDALPGDPVPQTPSLEEAKALVDERLGVALAAKYRELLSELDLELSRYSTTWWDDAARHDETDVPAEFLEALAMTDGEARQAQALSSSIALVVDDTGEVTGTARVMVSTDGVPVVVSDSASPVVPIEDQIAAFLQRLPAERARTRALQRSLAASIPTNAVLEDIEDLAAAFPRWEDNVGRQVHPGEFYTYDGTDVYRVVQGHVTQADWSPPLAPALFLYLPPAGPSGCPPFVQPTGAHDAYAIGDCVEFEGANYVSLIDANTYSPSAYPAGWELQE